MSRELGRRIEPRAIGNTMARSKDHGRPAEVSEWAASRVAAASSAAGEPAFAAKALGAGTSGGWPWRVCSGRAALASLNCKFAKGDRREHASQLGREAAL